MLVMFILEKHRKLMLQPFSDTLSFTVEGVTVGITGGEGFNKYPGIPRVLTSTIDAQTDDKGKLNASITVQAEK